MKSYYFGLGTTTPIAPTPSGKVGVGIPMQYVSPDAHVAELLTSISDINKIPWLIHTMGLDTARTYAKVKMGLSDSDFVQAIEKCLSSSKSDCDMQNQVRWAIEYDSTLSEQVRLLEKKREEQKYKLVEEIKPETESASELSVLSNNESLWPKMIPVAIGLVFFKQKLLVLGASAAYMAFSGKKKA